MLSPTIQRDLARSRIDDMHRRAGRDRMAKAANRSRHAGTGTRSRPVLGRVTAAVATAVGW